MAIALQVLLAVAYALLAHVASVRVDDRYACAALVVLVLLVLMPSMIARRFWSWLALPALLAVAWVIYLKGFANLPLLLVPVVFVGLVAYWFGRSLLPGQVPRITRIVAALDGVPAAQLAPELRGYTRSLTAVWAGLLLLLGTINLALALIASPGGLLASAGIDPPVTITREQWSWFANLFNYGIVGGTFVIEYAVRKRYFPERHSSVADFVRKLVALGPGFWRDFLR